MYGYNIVSILFLPILLLLVFNLGIWLFDFYSISDQNKIYLITLTIIVITILNIIGFFLTIYLSPSMLCDTPTPDPIIVADPLKQLVRGYDSEGINQPLLGNIAQVLSDQRGTYKVLTHAFSSEMRTFVASYLCDQDIDTYYKLLNTKTDSFTAWSKINNTISFRAGLLSAT